MLTDSRRRHEVGTCDLLGSEPAQQSQGQGNLGLLREHGMAGHEHQSKQVVSDGSSISLLGRRHWTAADRLAQSRLGQLCIGGVAGPAPFG